MARTVDEAYWQDYFRTHNERRFGDLVRDFYAEDAVFQNPKVMVRGHAQLLDFFEQANRDVHIDLVPRAILIDPGLSAVELNCVMHAAKDLPDFLLGAMEKGDEASMGMASIYHLRGDRIIRARIYWGALPMAAR